MRLSKHRRPTQATMDMTPMIDIVFQLLIFFMTVNQVSAVNRTQLELPKQSGVEDQQTTSITINVGADGVLSMSGNDITAAELATVMADEVAKLEGDAGRAHVVLRGDRRGSCGPVNEVMQILQSLGIRRVHLAVESSGG